MNEATECKIGLALSGGGARAMAFHLGCLRALKKLGLLDRVSVLSTVSGGSVIGALYAASDEPFEDFEARLRAVLAKGLMGATVRAAFFTPEGLKALLCFCTLGPINLAFVLATWLAWFASLLLPAHMRPRWPTENCHLPFRRYASRTTIFRRAVDHELFHGKKLVDLASPRPFLIINAAELRTGSAFYFSARESGAWRFGRLAQPDISLAHAVTASAAYPLFLPALDEDLAFDGPVALPPHSWRRSGTWKRRR
jgi:NTE family protein